jgi:hypothetical protein
VHWPSRVDVKHIVISGPRANRARQERRVPLRTLAGLEASGTDGQPSVKAERTDPSTADAVALTVNEVVVKDFVAWRTMR